MHRSQDYRAQLRQIEPMRQFVAQDPALSCNDLDTAQPLGMRAAQERSESTECTLGCETVQVEGARRPQSASAEAMPARAVNAARMGADRQCGGPLAIAVRGSRHRQVR